MIRHPFFASCGWLLASAGLAWADLPVASYIFPAGGQRGQSVEVRVGGLFLHERCGFEIIGPGVQWAAVLSRMKTLFFEGPILPLPESQQAEDYPQDMAGRIRIAPDAPLGARSWRLWTSQGASSGPIKFVVGDLPEIVEQEIEGDPIPVEVKLPVTINGRIFPRENVDIWTFQAKKGQTITAEVHAARLGSPLDSRLEVIDPQGKRIAENDDAFGADSKVRFGAMTDGRYQVRIQDVQFRGGPAYVYRLTLTADPYVDRVYPLGGRRGSTVAFEIAGQRLPREPIAVPLPAAGTSDYSHRLNVGGKLTNPILIAVDDLPEYLETEPNDQPAQARPVAVPAILNGRIDKPGDVDYWAMTARKGEVFTFELRAHVLGSPLHALLAVVDGSGKELARADNLAQPRMDPSFQWAAPADGTYYVRIAEAFHSRGGPDYAYRLRVQGVGKPDFLLRLADDVVTVPRGGQAKIKVTVERTAAPGPIPLSVEGLPPGVTALPAKVGDHQGVGEITFKADAAAAIRTGRLTIRGTMQLGKQTLTRTAIVPGSRGGMDVDTILLAVALPTPFRVIGGFDMRWAARGTVFQRHYQIERGGFTGPLEVRLADRQARHLQGVTASAQTVPPDASEFDYAIHLPPWMVTGRTCRVCVMAIGVVKDPDGTEHTVSFSSIQPNDQFIVVVEPGRLDVEAEQASFLAVPGQVLSVPVRVTRGKGLRGPVTLELIRPRHLQAIQAEPIVVPAGQSQKAFPIRFGLDMTSPINTPLVLRATLMDQGKPVVAETRLDIQCKD
jgi:hypothetical protein